MNAKIRLFKGKTHADGTHPIQVQYYIDGKTKRETVARCKADDWDERASRLRGRARNASIINHRITQVITEAEKLVYSILTGETDKAVIFHKAKAENLKSAIANEIERFKKDINPTMVKKINSYERIIGEYSSLDHTSLSQVNVRWLEGLVSTLRSKGNKSSTISKTTSFVKRLLKRYYKLPKEVEDYRVAFIVKPVREKLTIDEFKAMQKLDLTELPGLEVVRDIFVLQVYLRGIRIGDILQAKCNDFKEGRFFYTADKTGKQYSINVIEPAEAIILRYKGRGEYLFPLFTWCYNSRLSAYDNEKLRLDCKTSATSTVNKALKEIAKKAGITKPLSSHIARHTFARMAIDKINNPMATMELLGHSSLAIHQQYLNDIRKDDVLDAAADDIFG